MQQVLRKKIKFLGNGSKILLKKVSNFQTNKQITMINLCLCYYGGWVEYFEYIYLLMGIDN